MLLLHPEGVLKLREIAHSFSSLLKAKKVTGFSLKNCKWRFYVLHAASLGLRKPSTTLVTFGELGVLTHGSVYPRMEPVLQTCSLFLCTALLLECLFHGLDGLCSMSGTMYWYCNADKFEAELSHFGGIFFPRMILCKASGHKCLDSLNCLPELIVCTQRKHFARLSYLLLAI